MILKHSTFLDLLKCLEKSKNVVEKSTWCLTVCTSSVLLAKTGLLDNYEATSNKMVFKTAREWNMNGTIIRIMIFLQYNTTQLHIMGVRRNTPEIASIY